MSLIATTSHFSFGQAVGHCHGPISVAISLVRNNQTRKVLINSSEVIVVGDTYILTNCGVVPHPASGANFCIPNSSVNKQSVWVLGQPVIVVGDLLTCGDMVGNGTNNSVFAY